MQDSGLGLWEMSVRFWVSWNRRILSFHFQDQFSKLDFLLTIQFSCYAVEFVFITWLILAWNKVLIKQKSSKPHQNPKN